MSEQAKTETAVCGDCGKPFSDHRKLMSTGSKSYCYPPDTRHWFEPAERASRGKAAPVDDVEHLAADMGSCLCDKCIQSIVHFLEVGGHSLAAMAVERLFYVELRTAREELAAERASRLQAETEPLSPSPEIRYQLRDWHHVTCNGHNGFACNCWRQREKLIAELALRVRV